MFLDTPKPRYSLRQKSYLLLLCHYEAFQLQQPFFALEALVSSLCVNHTDATRGAKYFSIPISSNSDIDF